MLAQAERCGLNVGVRLPPSWMVLDVDPRNFPEGRDPLAELAGASGLHIANPSQLVGRFNSHLQNCILLFADEAFWAGDKAGESVLKALVTEPTITYEGKGRDAVSGKNLIHIVMASNSDWVVPAGLGDERRFAVFEVNGSRRGDKAFFDALNAQLYGNDRAGLAKRHTDQRLASSVSAVSAKTRSGFFQEKSAPCRAPTDRRDIRPTENFLD